MTSFNAILVYEISASRVAVDGTFNWVKMKMCKCVHPKFAEVRFSSSTRNPRKPYYKCRDNGCEFFDWVTEGDVCSNLLLYSTPNQAVRESVLALREKVEGFSKIQTRVVKLLIVFLVVVVAILLKGI